MNNRTLVIDLSKLPSEVVGTLIGAARERGIQHTWPNNALLCALDPAVGAHREFEEAVRSAGLSVHLR